ncbi:DMT family transporter [Saxibacter everestensis]|uniref:DMT family transporter n=1 Tax=Saxibacter everestensis TaxID=2909229 RepID=A0ABY8QV58_9MICO|nr:DMT family transporter [Brevibacteriaceae bacterium ZFBP1038]
MSTLALLLVLGGAFAHATWNLAAKGGASSGPPFVWVCSLVSVIVLAPFAVFTLATTDVLWGPMLLGGGISGILHAGYFLLLQRGYLAGDISLVYPMARGSGPLLSVIFAVVLFGERPSLLALLGAAAVIAGVAVIGLAGARLQRINKPAIGFGLATGVIIAGYTLWDAFAVTELAASPIVLSWLSSVVEVMVISPLLAGKWDEVRAVWAGSRRQAMIVGIGSPVAYILVLFAMQIAPVSLVAPGREFSVVLVSLAGWLWLKEPHPQKRLAGAVVVLCGVILIAFG